MASVETASPVPRGDKWEEQGTSRRGARRSDEMRGGEDRCRGRRSRGEGETEKRARAPAPLRAGPGRSGLPSRLRSAPPLSPAPYPTDYPASEAGQGKYPPRGLLVPEQVCSLYIPRTLASTRVQSLQSRRPPHQIRPRTRARRGPTSRPSAVPQRGTRLSGDLDPAGRAPEGTERTDNLCTKGRRSGGNLEPGVASLKVGAPQSTYTPRGP